MTTTATNNDLMHRVSECLANVASVSSHIGGISQLSKKLVKRARKCNTPNLTPAEALLLSWALGTCVNLQLSLVEDGIREIEVEHDAAVRDAFKSYTHAHHSAPVETVKVKGGKRSGEKRRGRGIHKV